MNAPLIAADRGWLLKRWCAVLKFRIGNADSARLDQLPNGECFPNEYPAEDAFRAAWVLREVLGVAILKLIRPWPADLGARACIDGSGGWLMDLRVLGYELIGDAPYLSPLGLALQIALRAPDRLPVLIARIDALNNRALHDMAMAAVQGLPVADVFDGLLSDDLVEGADD